MSSYPDEAQKPAPFINCSECKAPRRDRYFMVNDRPVCAKCHAPYAKMVKAHDGVRAFWLVAARAFGVAVVGALLLSIVERTFPVARIFVFIPIGYAMGKVVMGALHGYSARRFQYLAVALTYGSFIAGMTGSAVRDANKEAKEFAETEAEMVQMMKEVQASDPAAAGAIRESGGSTVAVESETNVLNSLMLVAALPLIRTLQFGINFAAVTILALGYALYQAWKQTDGQGMQLSLRGPYRPGEGPIPAR